MITHVASLGRDKHDVVVGVAVAVTEEGNVMLKLVEAPPQAAAGFTPDFVLGTVVVNESTGETRQACCSGK